MVIHKHCLEDNMIKRFNGKTTKLHVNHLHEIIKDIIYEVLEDELDTRIVAAKKIKSKKQISEGTIERGKAVLFKLLKQADNKLDQALTSLEAGRKDWNGTLSKQERRQILTQVGRNDIGTAGIDISDAQKMLAKIQDLMGPNGTGVTIVRAARILRRASAYIDEMADKTYEEYLPKNDLKDELEDDIENLESYVKDARKLMALSLNPPNVGYRGAGGTGLSAYSTYLPPE